jgi:hypothetical protein
MTSIGYSSAINGSNVAFQNFVVNAKNSGGAINGYMQQLILIDIFLINIKFY